MRHRRSTAQRTWLECQRRLLAGWIAAYRVKMQETYTLNRRRKETRNTNCQKIKNK
jgi:hypothetical protein